MSQWTPLGLVWIWLPPNCTSSHWSQDLVSYGWGGNCHPQVMMRVMKGKRLHVFRVVFVSGFGWSGFRALTCCRDSVFNEFFVPLDQMTQMSTALYSRVQKSYSAVCALMGWTDQNQQCVCVRPINTTYSSFLQRTWTALYGNNGYFECWWDDYADECIYIENTKNIEFINKSYLEYSYLSLLFTTTTSKLKGVKLSHYETKTHAMQ